MKKLILAMMLLSSAQMGFAAQDIAGIKIGVDFPSQEHLIKKANPDYKFVEFKNSKGEVTGVRASTKKDAFVVLYTPDKIVWFVGRAQSFDKGGRPETDTLVSDLKAKYGKPTRSDFGKMTWEYDRSGKQVLDRGARECGNGIVPQYLARVPGGSVSAPSSFSSSCGYEISSLISKDISDEEMVSAFSVTIADHKIMYDLLSAEEEQKAAARNRELEEERAKVVRPQL